MMSMAAEFAPWAFTTLVCRLAGSHVDCYATGHPILIAQRPLLRWKYTLTNHDLRLMVRLGLSFARPVCSDRSPCDWAIDAS